jgi:hypothetical protein
MSNKKHRLSSEKIFSNLEMMSSHSLLCEEADYEIKGLTSIAGQPIREVADTSKIPRLRKFRVQLLHQWLLDNFAPCKVADIGGGKGLLSYLLVQSGWDATVIDPFEQALPGKYKDIQKGRRAKIAEGLKVPYIQAEFQSELAEPFDLLIGLHAHGCNVKIMDAAAQYGCGFILFACCVIDEPFYPRLGVHWLESLAAYAVLQGQVFYPFRLNFKGQNIGLCKVGRCPVKAPEPTQ